MMFSDRDIGRFMKVHRVPEILNLIHRLIEMKAELEISQVMSDLTRSRAEKLCRPREVILRSQ